MKLISILVEEKPNNYKQTCHLCGNPIKKGEKRVSVPDISSAGFGKYYIGYVHFHYSCFLYWLSKHFPEIKLPDDIVAEVTLQTL